MAYADILAGQLVALTPMELTQSKRDLLLSLRGNISVQAGALTNVTGETQTKLNDLDTRLNAIGNAANVDIDQINATLTAITNLQTDGSIGSTFIGVLGTIYSELNTREISSTFEKVVNTANGILEVDVSGYGFSALGEYNVQVSFAGTAPVTASYDKISANMFRVYLRTHEEWEFDEAGTASLKDCSTENVVVSITVSRLPAPMTATFNEVDGDVTTIGTGAGSAAAVDTVAPDAPTLTIVGDGALTNIVTASGTAEVGATVNVTFPSGEIVPVVADANGAYTAVSTVAQPDGNVTANATDAASNTSVSAIAAFVAFVIAGGSNAL